MKKKHASVIRQNQSTKRPLDKKQKKLRAAAYCTTGVALAGALFFIPFGSQGKSLNHALQALWKHNTRATYSTLPPVQMLSLTPVRQEESLRIQPQACILHPYSTLQFVLDGPGSKGNAIEWESMDESVAIVQNGLVRALKGGETLIRARTQNGLYSAQAMVTVSGEANPVNDPGMKDRDIASEQYRILSYMNVSAKEILQQIRSRGVDYDQLRMQDLLRLVQKIKTVYGDYQIPTGTVVCKKATDLARLTTFSYLGKNVGPIALVPAQLHANGQTQSVTLVALCGTNIAKGQATGIFTDILSGFELNNDYLVAAYNAILYSGSVKGKDIHGNERTGEILRRGDSLFLTGMSLGGMVAQQLLAQEGIQDNFRIPHMVSFGSPLIAPDQRPNDTMVRRFADKSDIIPTLSISNTPENQAAFAHELIKSVQSEYKTAVGAHVFSYVDSSVWDSYDVIGVENGSATLTYQMEDVLFFDAPTINQSFS